jgi:hypothetical protein
VPLTVYTTCSELGPEQPLLRLRLDIPSTDCTILPAQTAIDSGRWAMKITTALHPNWVRDRHVQASSCPFWLRGSAVSACVKILGNVNDNRLEREEQLTEQRKHGRAERRERKGHPRPFTVKHVIRLRVLPTMAPVAASPTPIVSPLPAVSPATAPKDKKAAT